MNDSYYEARDASTTDYIYHSKALLSISVNLEFPKSAFMHFKATDLFQIWTHLLNLNDTTLY